MDTGKIGRIPFSIRLRGLKVKVMMSLYEQQLRAHDDALDEMFWRSPEGINVAGDPLKFLYIPDAVEAFMMTVLAKQVYEYQVAQAGTNRQITQAVMVTMGGLLPGVLLHDHLAWKANPVIPIIEFGTIGVEYYAGPGQPLDAPRIVQPLTADVTGQTVAVVDDLIDLGGTARFVSQYLQECGALESVLVAPYVKNKDVLNEMEVIFFGTVPKDTWIITPRERVETLIKRVPYWREQGASLQDCEESLLAIGYPRYLLNIYLKVAYRQ